MTRPINPWLNSLPPIPLGGLTGAIVHNNFTEDKGMVDAPIGRDPKNRLRMAVVHRNGKEARTHYKVLERFGKFTYIEAVFRNGQDTSDSCTHLDFINHPC